LGTKLKAIVIPQLNFTNEQLFFVARAHKYCDGPVKNDRDFAIELVDTDPHGVGKVRVNSMVMHMSQFASVFHCNANDSMILREEERCYLLSKHTL
jgi:predicted metalloendopeptidase